MSNRERNSRLDIIRIVAVLAVIMIYTSANFVTSFDVFSTEFIGGNIFDSLLRIGVPLFVTISGSLMLDENRNIIPKIHFLKMLQTSSVY